MPEGGKGAVFGKASQQVAVEPEEKPAGQRPVVVLISAGVDERELPLCLLDASRRVRAALCGCLRANDGCDNRRHVSRAAMCALSPSRRSGQKPVVVLSRLALGATAFSRVATGIAHL